MTSVARLWNPINKNLYFVKTMMVLGALVGVSLPTMAQSLSEAVLPMTGTEQSLVVFNKSNSLQSLWISKPVLASEGLMEEKWDIPPHTQLEFPLLNYQDQSFLRMEALSTDLELSWSLRHGETPAVLPWGVSNELFLPQGLPHLTLWLSNTASVEQKVQLTGADNNALYKEWTLKPYETQKVTYRGTAGALKLKGELRISAVGSDAFWHRSLNFFPLPSTFAAKTKSSLFEVTNTDESESFVVEISDPKQIAAARNQIKSPQAYLSRLLIAQIAEGSNQVNQDLRSKVRAPWSWHVGKVFRFADFASIDCDGSPSLVEKTLPWWREARGGLICFWGYRITRELAP